MNLADMEEVVEMYKVILPGEVIINESVEKDNFQKWVGGSPLNIAVAISKHLVDVYFIGSVGNDDYGHEILKVFEQYNLDTSGIVKSKLPTTISRWTATSENQTSYKLIRGADANLNYSRSVSKLISNYNILYLGSSTALIGGGLWKSYYRLLEEAYKLKKIIVFDPHYSSDIFKNKKKSFIRTVLKMLKKVTIAKFTLKELKLLTNCDDLNEGVEKIRKIGPKLVLVTLGKDGALISANDKQIIVPTIDVDTVCMKGVGDAFLGAFVGQLAKKQISTFDLADMDFKDIVKKANISAALTTTKQGTFIAIPEWNEVEKIFKEKNDA